MSEVIEDFLSNHGRADWARMYIAGDASARRYLRLQASKGETAILMDARQCAPEEMVRFERIAGILHNNGLAAPRIFARDTGLMLLEDLGPTHIADAIANDPAQEQDCYAAIADVLAILHGTMTAELPQLDAQTAANALAPLADHFGTAKLDIADIQNALIHSFAALNMIPDRLALRDFHAENLIWRPDQSGTGRIGLLDFQDALFAPPGYDLASLTRDARRDVPKDLTDWLTQTLAQKINLDLPQFEAQVACLSVQRNLRILGIFANLIKNKGKPKYLSFVPRVWDHIICDLQHDALAELREAVLATIPVPDQNFLQGWLK